MGRTEILDCHLDEGKRTKLRDGIRRNFSGEMLGSTLYVHLVHLAGRFFAYVTF